LDGEIGGGGGGGEMSHLASGFGGVFFVEVETGFGNGEGAGERWGSRSVRCPEPEVAEEVDDGGGANDGGVPEGKIADGAHVLFELRGDTGALACMIGVVRARGHFIDQQLTRGGEEELDAEESFKPDLVGDSDGNVGRLLGDMVRETRG